MGTLLHDLRYACRTLWRSRTFTITALTVLALGIGANTTIYTVVRGLAFRPLPFDDPERLVFVGELSPGGRREPVAPANFADVAGETRAFEHLAIHRGARFILTGSGLAESVIGANVSDRFFSVLGVRPQHGRAFLPDDGRPGAARAAMLSDAGWRRLFSRDPAILGRPIALDGVDHTVVGVLPAGFSLWDTDVWVAGFDPALSSSRTARSMGAIGRLAGGASLDGARAELDTIARRLAAAYPATNAGWSFRALPLQEAWLGGYRSTSLMLLGAAAMVLLIACGNVANLLLERALSRDREIGLRLALGARRGRLVRQMLTESFVLALLGAGAGVVAAFWSLGFVQTLIPANTLTQIPGGAGAIRVDLHTLGVVLILAIVAAAVFGLAPAVRVARSGVQGALRESARGATRGRQGHFWRRALVVAQVALSAILLIAATLLIKSFRHLQGLERGYDADNALSVSLRLPPVRYPQPAEQQAFFTAVLERMRALPGVARAGGATLLSARGRPFVVDADAPASREGATAVYRAATPDYLSAIGIPLVRGRHFSPADGPAAPAVAIVNQSLARTAWPNADPVGRRLRLLGPPVDISLVVIGVAGDVKEALDPRSPLQLDARPTIYRPSAQEPVSAMTLVLRTDIDPLSLAAAVRREVAAVDSTIPVLQLQSVQQGLRQSMETPRFNAFLLTGFAALALLLAAVGVYGVIAYSVQQRTHEIGIRMALGASPGQVLRAVVGEGILLALAGVALGVAAAAGFVRFIAHYLFGVSATDPTAFAIGCMLLIVAATASYVPARRAAAVDPLMALRHE